MVVLAMIHFVVIFELPRRSTSDLLWLQACLDIAASEAQSKDAFLDHLSTTLDEALSVKKQLEGKVRGECAWIESAAYGVRNHKSL